MLIRKRLCRARHPKSANYSAQPESVSEFRLKLFWLIFGAHCFSFAHLFLTDSGAESEDLGVTIILEPAKNDRCIDARSMRERFCRAMILRVAANKIMQNSVVACVALPRFAFEKCELAIHFARRWPAENLKLSGGEASKI
jgi:hypothetical protein